MAGELISVSSKDTKPQKLTAAQKIMILDPREMARDATPIFIAADVNAVRNKRNVEGKPSPALFSSESPSTQDVWEKMKESYGMVPEIDLWGKAAQGSIGSNAIENYQTIEQMMEQLYQQIYGAK